jgi:hypothetical protein
MERQSDKEAKALKSLLANRKYRQNMRDKLTAVQTDTRLDDILGILKLIQKRMDVSDSEDSDEDTDDEPVKRVKKKMTKLESDSEEEEVKRVKTKKTKKKKKLESDSEEEEVKMKKKVEPNKVKTEVETEGLQRKNPMLFNYPTYV